MKHPVPIPDEVVDLVARADWITVFTGAGMSAESGLATFRDADSGLWEHVDPTELATPEAWERDPALVWGWYRWRAQQVHRAQPNAGHLALAELAADRAVMIVTQNVDDLHERAGSEVLSHLHGSLFAPRCSICHHPCPDGGQTPTGTSTGTSDPIPRLAPATLDEIRIPPPACPVCGGAVRPGVVWFGEALPVREWDRAEQAFRGSDLVLVVGTSGVVAPAAGLPERAARAGIPVVELNPEPSALTPIATHSLRTTAATGLPALVDAIGRP